MNATNWKPVGGGAPTVERIEYNVTDAEMSERMLKALWRQLEQGYPYEDLLQFSQCYWSELANSTNSIPAVIVILAMAKNTIVEAGNITDGHIKQVLTDLTQENPQLEQRFEKSYRPHLIKILKNSNPNVYIDIAQQGIDRLISRSLGSMICSEIVDQSLPITDDLLSGINNSLCKKDALRFSSTCKKFYFKLNSTLEIHRWKFKSIEDGEKFKAADELIRMTNKKLPELRKPWAYYEKKWERSEDARTSFFHHLVKDCVDLYLYLRKNPQLVNDKDCHTWNLLHYAAIYMVFENAILVQQLLFNTPGIDLHIKEEREGRTALHLALQWNKGHFSSQKEQEAFHYFADQAISRGFNCSTKGRWGSNTILVDAALFTYGDKNYFTWEEGNTNLSTLLKLMVKHKVPNLPSVLNALDDGTTAFYWCIQRRALDAAAALLDAGADPELYEYSPKNNPLAAIIEGKKKDPGCHWEIIDQRIGDKLARYLEEQKPLGEKMTKAVDENCVIS